MTSSVVGPRSSKALPKAKFAPKKGVMVTVWWSSMVQSTTAFRIQAKPWHLRSMLSKSMRFPENCNAYSWCWSTESPILLHDNFQPHHTTNATKVEWIGIWSFASSTIFTWPLTNHPPLLQASWQVFAGKMLLQPAGCRKCFARVSWILKYEFLCYRKKTNLFLLGKNVWNVMVPILI